MDVEVLNKSAIVLLVACWEAYIEDLAANGFEFMLSSRADHNAFSSKVLTLASNPLRNSLNEKEVWALAGTGWKQVMQKHKDETIRALNTPKSEKVDDLYRRLFGLKRLSSNWHWKGMTVEKAKNKLDSLVSLRGDIAHRVSTGRTVTKQLVISNGDFIGSLVVVSSNALWNAPRK